MTTIPEDVMQKAEAAYLASLHDSMAGKADYLRHIAGAILAERARWCPATRRNLEIINMANSEARKGHTND